MEKKKSLSMLLLLFFSLITTAFASNLSDEINLKGQSNTWLGDYQIKELPAVMENGQTMRAFELSYANVANKVVIYLNERKDCREYVVRSKNLEIKYVCNKAGFGAKLLSGKFMKYDPEINARFLSDEEFKKQSKISEGGLKPDVALGLIASYYPYLLKSPYLLD